MPENPPDDLPPQDAASVGDGDPPPPKSPFTLGTIRNLNEDEILGVALTGTSIEQSVSAELAGSVLTTLNDLVTMLAAGMKGVLHKRGRAMLPPNVGELRLDAFALGSAAFYFTAGHGDHYQLTDEGSVGTSIGDVVEELLSLVASSRSEDVLEVARQYSDRIAAKYVDLLEVVVAEQVDVAWESPKRQVELPRAVAGRALAILERTDEVDSREEHVSGLLYEANARTRGFRLQREDGSTIMGKFDERLVDSIGSAWNQEVFATVRVRVERLARSGEERLRRELIGVKLLSEISNSPAEPTDGPGADGFGDDPPF